MVYERSSATVATMDYIIVIVMNSLQAGVPIRRRGTFFPIS